MRQNLEFIELNQDQSCHEFWKWKQKFILFFFAINTNFYVNTCFIWYFLHKKEQEIKKKI